MYHVDTGFTNGGWVVVWGADTIIASHMQQAASRHIDTVGAPASQAVHPVHLYSAGCH